MGPLGGFRCGLDFSDAELQTKRNVEVGSSRRWQENRREAPEIICQQTPIIAFLKGCFAFLLFFSFSIVEMTKISLFVVWGFYLFIYSFIRVPNVYATHLYSLHLVKEIN